MRQNLQEDVDSTVINNIQSIVYSKMSKIEQAIHQTLQRWGKMITDQAKSKIKEQIDRQTQTLEILINQEIDDAFYKGSTLLNQAVLKIGEEMDKATNKFRENLFSSEEIEKQIARLRRQSIMEIRPLVEDLMKTWRLRRRKQSKRLERRQPMTFTSVKAKWLANWKQKCLNTLKCPSSPRSGDNKLRL